MRFNVIEVHHQFSVSPLKLHHAFRSMFSHAHFSKKDNLPTFWDFCREETVLEKSCATASKLASSKRNSGTKQDIKFQHEDD